LPAQLNQIIGDPCSYLGGTTCRSGRSRALPFFITAATGRPTLEPHLHDLARLRRVRDRIDREHAHPLDVEALARDAHMSAGHLSRQFRLAYGESPYSYLMTRRVERAMALLRRGNLSVTDVCLEVGCASLGTFTPASPNWSACPGDVPARVGRCVGGNAAVHREASD
jgi:AraC-like DNA-binding protein